MAYDVAGDLYYELDGQLLEIKRQLRQRGGYPYDPNALKALLQRGIEGNFVMGDPAFKRDMRKEGWKLLEHAPRRITSTADLEGISFLKGGEGFVNGEEMMRRARFELDANYGQEDAEFLLDHQDEIPTALRPYLLVFTATVWEASHGRRYVAYLRWPGERWDLPFHWLDRGFRSHCRLLRPRK